MKFPRSIILLILSSLLAAAYASAQIPNGYYNQASGLTGPQLKTALHRIIRSHSVISYNALWSAFYTTDDKPNGTVWDMYSDIPDSTPNGSPPYIYYFGTDQCSVTPGSEGICYNREHSFPNSWFGGNSGDTMYTDLFHLYPVDSYVNTMRNNYPYGEVGSPTWTSQNGSMLGPCIAAGYTGTVFEPRDEYKGDFARTYFYMATRYESRIASWQSYPGADAVLNGTAYPCYDQWFLDLLLAWASADPVSQKEVDRNNEIYSSFQHNRNPYIDHPEYVNAVWESIAVSPEPVSYPANFSAHNLHLHWSDATGPIVPTGYLVRMSVMGFADIQDPSDGMTYSNSTTDQNVPYGLQDAWFINLDPNTTYYFKLYSYTGSGPGINYKTDGPVPQIHQTTSP